MARLVLYNYWRSSSSHRVRIALALKGLAYEYAAVNLVDGEQGAAEHRARSVTGFVPCLTVDGVAYVESVAIVELLEQLFPSPPLYPADAHGRARVRALVEIVNSGIQPFQNLRVLKALEQMGQDTEGQNAWLQQHIGRGLAAFERAMEEAAREGVRGPYAYGETPGAADAFLVPQVDAAKRFRVNLGAYPRVAAAHAAAVSLEPFQRAAADRQPDSPKN